MRLKDGNVTGPASATNSFNSYEVRLKAYQNYYKDGQFPSFNSYEVRLKARALVNGNRMDYRFNSYEVRLKGTVNAGLGSYIF